MIIITSMLPAAARIFASSSFCTCFILLAEMVVSGCYLLSLLLVCLLWSMRNILSFVRSVYSKKTNVCRKETFSEEMCLKRLNGLVDHNMEVLGYEDQHTCIREIQ